jgi:hypothetical protein
MVILADAIKLAAVMQQIARIVRSKACRLSAWLCLLLIVSAAWADPSAPTQGPESLKEPRKVQIEGQEFYSLGFDRLSSFDYVVTDAGTGASAAEIETARKRDQIPPWLRFYNDKHVVLTGFMLPLQLEKGVAKKLILMKDMSTCCFGAAPKMNDYVVVTMKNGVDPTQDIPVSMTGIVHISEQYENGMVVSLFQLEGEKFLGAKKE